MNQARILQILGYGGVAMVVVDQIGKTLVVRKRIRSGGRLFSIARTYSKADSVTLTKAFRFAMSVYLKGGAR